jgi:phosphatidylserine/phosphatidylglycerophosphate/cardiolipin synthase-like enzyme
MNREIHLIGKDWKNRLESLLKQANHDIIISSPYVSSEGAEFVTSTLRSGWPRILKAHILTDLSPPAVAQGVNDPKAILRIGEVVSELEVIHLPRVHAKVYLADSARAIITSGNLTTGGLERNYEYGVEIRDVTSVGIVRNDLLAYSTLGARFSVPELHAYAAQAESVTKEFRKSQRSIARAAQLKLRAALIGIEDELIRRRLAGGPVHTVFAKTILYLLARNGPLSTANLHKLVSEIHPDLCDNTIDRVIDGKRFGKKWKHAVRTAQQQLKKRGQVKLVGEKWVRIS